VAGLRTGFVVRAYFFKNPGRSFRFDLDGLRLEFVCSLLFCLSALLVEGCRTHENRHEREITGTETTRLIWVKADQKAVIYDANEQTVHEEDAKIAEYVMPAGPALIGNELVTVAAFTDSRTGIVYIGRRADFYIENTNGITGADISSHLGGDVIWRKSWISSLAPGESLTNPVGLFENLVAGENWARRCQSDYESTTNLNLLSVFGLGFVANSSAVPMIAFEGVTLKGGIIELKFRNLTGGLEGTVSIDLLTRKPTKAVLNGEQVFPASSGTPVFSRLSIPSAGD
jgi:hypothetical protein